MQVETQTSANKGRKSAAKTLEQLVDEAFTPGGALADVLGAGYRASAEQHGYAKLMAGLFEAGRDEDRVGSAAMIEAETGVGKSLGYLVPMGLTLARTGCKGLVATHTLELVTQIVEREFPLAAKIVERLTNRKLTCKPRYGLGSWLSAPRLAETIRLLDESDPNHEALADLRKAQEISQEPGFNGLIDSLEARLEQPLPISRDLICLVTSSGADAGAYRNHVEESKDADVIVVSHMLLGADLKYHRRELRPLTSENTYEVVVVDEAENFSGALRTLMGEQISAIKLEALAGAPVDGAEAAELREAVGAFREMARQVLVEAVPPPEPRRSAARTLVLTHPSHALIRADAVAQAEKLLAILTSWDKRSANRKYAKEDIRAVRTSMYSLKVFIETCIGKRLDGSDGVVSSNLLPVLLWSPDKAFPSMAVEPIKVRNLAQRLWNPRHEGEEGRFGAIAFTSACLDAPGPRMTNFKEFANDVGLMVGHKLAQYANYREEFNGRFSPKDAFGAMDIVLTHRAVPNPTGVDRKPDPLWLDHCANMVEAAHKRGGRTLVLASSFERVGLIASRLRLKGVDVIEQEPGDRLGAMLDLYRAKTDAVLLSPSAWAGVNLPGLIQNLVITSIPYLALDTVNFQMLRHYLTMDARQPLSEREAEAVLRGMSQRHAAKKLRQGIGRLIRTASDKGTLWIADPRFPHPTRKVDFAAAPVSSQGFGAFAYCIPERFRTHGLRPAYSRAKVFPAA